MGNRYTAPERRSDQARKADLSPSAVNRAVLTESLQKPYVLYPTAIGALGILASILIAPAAMFLIPAIAGTSIGAGAWLFDSTLRREHHAHQYLKSMHELLVTQLDDSIRSLENEFSGQGFEKGKQQLNRLNNKFQAFRELLQRKLDPNELTHSRYLGMTEQVFLGGLDNLRLVANTMKSISAIDRDGLRKRISELESEVDTDEWQERELSALKSRMLLYDQQKEKIDSWLTQNEEAMTQIDQVMAAIASMETEQGHASMDLENAMQELKMLASRADRYSRTTNE